MSKSYFLSCVFLTLTSGHVTCNLFLCKSSHLTTLNIICGQRDGRRSHNLSHCYHRAGSEKTDSSFFNSLSPRSLPLCWACWTRKLVGLPSARADLNCWSWRISRCRVDKLSCPLDCLGVNISWGDFNRITVTAVFKLNNNHQHYLWWYSF